ncbi:hypothetical protein EV401DRAFT_2084938 [Pisolithus croceorrhizus]|nr:hypothetical protein EV401DRAFT_2084938 [Pisolithus croceorrhizus]
MLEGAPDPFPVLGEEAPVRARDARDALNTDSHSDFPSLVSSTPAAQLPPKSAWGADSGPRIKANVRTASPVSLGEVMKQVMSKFKVKIEASANQKARQTTFHMKGRKAKRHLLSFLSPVVTLTVLAPVSTIGFVIGTTLKQIRDQFGEASTSNGTIHETSSGLASVEVDAEEEPLLITIIGPQPLALEARDMITSIVCARSSRVTQRVKDIPSHILPFVTVLRSRFLQAAQGGDIQLILNAEREVVVSGDREAVIRVVEAIKAAVQSFKTALHRLPLSLPKRHHRLLAGKAQEDIFMKSKCSVVVPDAEDPSEEVFVYGRPEDLSSGLGTVMEMANSQHPDASVFIPSAATATEASVLNVDIVGEKSVVDAVVRQMSELLGKLIGATKEVPIDWLSHEVIKVKNAEKLERFHEVDNVQVFFPPESTQQSSVLLKEKHLDEVSQALLEMAKEVADIKTEVLPIEKRWHKALIGKDGNILDFIIGEDRALLVKFGVEAGDPSTEDVVWLRGIRSDVDSAVQKIYRVVEDAKEDAIASSYFTEFEIDKEFVGRIVGIQGVNINKLREQFNVRVDVFDEVDDKEKEFSKKKKSATQKAKLKITGRKENADEAKKRILVQVEKLADETTETLKIPAQYHASLIGQNGKYVVRLEDNYGVKINFPRQSSDNGEGKRELKADEVVIKGGKKGVALAKNELLEALDFEKETNNTLKFLVPGRAISRILGRGGATINEIKDETGAQLDIERSTEDKTADAYVTARGTKGAINAAKTAILAIVDEVPEEASEILYIEQKYHRSIIGPGGQGLKDLIIRCGGPSDHKLQAGLVKFPRQGDISDEVRLRGEPGIVSRLKDELENKVSVLRDRIVVAVEIPAAQHRNIIGRGGQHLNDLQNRHDVQIQLPGSRGYGQVGEPSNAGEVESADPGDVVKVSGSRSACEAAISDMKNYKKGPVIDGPTAVVSVPLMYHDAVLQQGALFRTLRSLGVQVEQSVQRNRPTFPTQPPQSVNFNARIDAEGTPEADWQVESNYQCAEEGSSEWTLKAIDAASLERAQSEIQAAIEQAKVKTHIGFLTLPDRSVFPRLVGTKGSNITRLRNETGTDITIGRENNTIVIVGSESAIEAAKEAILSQVMASRAGRR